MKKEKLELDIEESWSTPPPPIQELSKRDKLLERLRKRKAYKEYEFKTPKSSKP